MVDSKVHIHGSVYRYSHSTYSNFIIIVWVGGALCNGRDGFIWSETWMIMMSVTKKRALSQELEFEETKVSIK